MAPQPETHHPDGREYVRNFPFSTRTHSECRTVLHVTMQVLQLRPTDSDAAWGVAADIWNHIYAAILDVGPWIPHSGKHWKDAWKTGSKNGRPKEWDNTVKKPDDQQSAEEMRRREVYKGWIDRAAGELNITLPSQPSSSPLVNPIPLYPQPTAATHAAAAKGKSISKIKNASNRKRASSTSQQVADDSDGDDINVTYDSDRDDTDIDVQPAPSKKHKTGNTPAPSTPSFFGAEIAATAASGGNDQIKNDAGLAHDLGGLRRSSRKRTVRVPNHSLVERDEEDAAEGSSAGEQLANDPSTTAVASTGASAEGKGIKIGKKAGTALDEKPVFYRGGQVVSAPASAKRKSAKVSKGSAASEIKTEKTSATTESNAHVLQPVSKPDTSLLRMIHGGNEESTWWKGGMPVTNTPLDGDQILAIQRVDGPMRKRGGLVMHGEIDGVEQDAILCVAGECGWCDPTGVSNTLGRVKTPRTLGLPVVHDCCVAVDGTTGAKTFVQANGMSRKMWKKRLPSVYQADAQVKFDDGVARTAMICEPDECEVCQEIYAAGGGVK